MNDVEIQGWFDLFEKIGGVYYRTILLPQWEIYEGCKEPWQAIAFFLERYAFERQGTNPGFAHAAADVVKESRLCSNCTRVEQEVWEKYKQRLNDRGINEKLCPLNPDESGERRSIFARLREAETTDLIQYCTRLLQSDVRSAHNFIKSIRGIGPKIASYFLRDLKEVASVTTNNLRFLLQPIDIWIWRTVHIMQDIEDFPRLGQVSEQEIEKTAQFVVNRAFNHNPERVNMGMWYFAAMVCESEYRHGTLMRDLEAAQIAWNDFVVYRQKEMEQIGLLRFQS